MSATILCVQGDREIGDLYVEALEAEGLATISARDGGQALEILRREGPDFIVLDVDLPRQDGFEILAELRTMPGRETLPVLLLSEDEPTPELAERARSLGAIGVGPSPIAPDRLLAWVSGAIETKAEGMGARAPEPSLPSEGRLRDIPFPELLHRLHRAQLDGVVLLEHGKKKKAIELRGGWPVSIKSNLVSECLGAYLVAQGRCSQAQLDQSLERMRAGEGLQGQILVAMEVLEEAEVGAVVRDHALAKVYEIFGWRDGQFSIRPRAKIQRGTSMGFDEHPSKLILEGVRRQTPLRLIERCFERNAGDLLRVETDPLATGLDSMALAAAELDWIRSLDGSTRVSALLEAPETVRRLSYALLAAGVLRLAGAGGRGRSGGGPATTIPDTTPDGSPPASSFDSADEERIRGELTRLANRLEGQDPYGVLDVSSGATDEEIRNAYAALAKQAHPDCFHGSSSSVRQLAAQVFDRISQAYGEIATAEARAAHAKTVSLGHRVAEVRDEGRRALEAETEFQRGEARMASRDYESALLCFGRAIEHFPSEGEYRSHYGWCLYLCHPDNDVILEEALEHCREGVRLAKDREKPYLMLGRLYKAMGKPGAARKMFTRAVQIKPQCVEAMRELRIMNMRREKDKGVLKRFFKR